MTGVQTCALPICFPVTIVQSNKTEQDNTNASVAADISQIKQTAAGISSTVQSNKTEQDNTNASLSSQISQTASSVNSIITNLNKSPDSSGYSVLTQLQDGINARVVKGDVINQINLTAEGTTIDGKYLHVTGTTKFDDCVS